MLRQARRPKFFAPLGSWRVAIADRPAERLGEDARIMVQIGRFRSGQIVDVTDVRRMAEGQRQRSAPGDRRQDSGARLRVRTLHPDRAMDAKDGLSQDVKGIITGPAFFMRTHAQREGGLALMADQ
jgi:hypothetical protein